MNDLKKRIESQTKRIKKAIRERPTLIGQTVYVGTFGLIFVLPIIAGAYFGKWLDSLSQGYSVRWTVSFILIGVFVGTLNVYFFIKE